MQARIRTFLPIALGLLVLVVGVTVHRLSDLGGSRIEADADVPANADTATAVSPARLQPKLLNWERRARQRTGSIPADALPWFEQGLNLYWSGNPTAARQSFLEGARLAPECAMCWWGAALAIGPVPGAGMRPSDNEDAYRWTRNAVLLSKNLDPREWGYIRALSLRYGKSIPDRRGPLDSAYAEELQSLVSEFPEDADLQVLYAEALIIVHGWDFSGSDNEQGSSTGRIRQAVEAALVHAPRHPGALRYRLHLQIGAGETDDALDTAATLTRIANGQGHLLHLPAHAYFATGDYAQAVKADIAAVEADRRFFSEWPLDAGLYASAHAAHHLQSLTHNQMMVGNFSGAMAAARALSSAVDSRRMQVRGYEGLQQQWVAPYLVLARFGRWPQILALPPPPANLAYATALWHYIRALAYLRSDALVPASRELSRLATIAAHPELQSQFTWAGNRFDQLAALAERILAAEIASARGELRLALEQLRQAAELEADLRPEYPQAWYLPVDQVLGAVLLAAGKAPEAEQAYRSDLDRHPRNGWSLIGLSKALAAQGKSTEAVDQRFASAWALADIELIGSRF